MNIQPPEPTSRVQAGSLAGILQSLDLGDSASRVKLLPDTMRIKDVAASLAEVRQALRNTVTSSVTNAKAKTGNGYSIEVFDTTTPAGRWAVFAIITRIK